MGEAKRRKALDPNYGKPPKVSSKDNIGFSDFCKQVEQVLVRLRNKGVLNLLYCPEKKSFDVYIFGHTDFTSVFIADNFLERKILEKYRTCTGLPVLVTLPSQNTGAFFDFCTATNSYQDCLTDLGFPVDLIPKIVESRFKIYATETENHITLTMVSK